MMLCPQCEDAMIDSDSVRCCGDCIEEYCCAHCGNMPEEGACFYCKAD